MIEKSNNIFKEASIKRIVQLDKDAKQLNILDQRFYPRRDKYYPSVTSILNYFPKNRFFEDWLKDVGHNADFIVKKSSEEGTAVHNAIDAYLAGEEIVWINPDGSVNYALPVWKMILKFADFWKTKSPFLIQSEYHLFSDIHEFAGTADIICKFDDKLWLLDVKTSNALHTSYELQLAAYATAWNETHEEKIDNVGILWLKSKKKGPDSKDQNIQGDGWELKTFKRSYDNSFKLFQNIYELYRLDHPEDKPYSETLPISIKL